MLVHSLMTTVVMALATTAGQPAAAAPTEAVVDNCDIASIDSPQLPASEAGMLINLHARDGQFVKKDMVLATIDDREAKALFDVKRLDYEVARQKAESDAELRHSIAAAEVARIAHEMYTTVNERQSGSISKLEVLKSKHEWDRTKLAIEKAREDVEANKLTAEAKRAEMEAARVALDRRKILAPFDGVVSMTMRQQGEWVQPGDAVIQLVAIDRLRVTGRLDATVWSRGDIENRKVTIEVTLPGGAVRKVEGKIVYVSPVIDVGSVLPVTAEFDTPMENGRPLIYAGMTGRITIHTNQPAIADARPEPPTYRPIVIAEPPAKTPPPARPTIAPASRRAPNPK